MGNRDRGKAQKKNKRPFGFTTATFIIRADRLEWLRDYAYTERTTLKEALDDVLNRGMTDVAFAYDRDDKVMLRHR